MFLTFDEDGMNEKIKDTTIGEKGFCIVDYQYVYFCGCSAFLCQVRGRSTSRVYFFVRHILHFIMAFPITAFPIQRTRRQEARNEGRD